MAEWEDAPASKTTASGWEDAPAPKTQPATAVPVAKDGWESAPTELTPEQAEAKRKEFSFAEETAKGAKGAFQYGLPSMAEQIKLQGTADAFMARQKNLELMNKIDSGEYKSLNDLKNDPEYLKLKDAGQNLAVLNTYFASRNTPEVAAKLRGRTQKEFEKMSQDAGTSIDLLNKYARENKKKYGARVENFTDIDWSSPQVAADFTNWLGHSMGSAGVQYAPIVLAGVVAKTPGVIGLSSTMETAGAVQNRMEAVGKKIQGLPEDQQKAAITKYLAETGDTNLMLGVASGAFDAVLGPSAKAAHVAAKEMVEQLGKRGAMKAAAKEIPKQLGEEAVTGALQEATQIGGKKALGESPKQITGQDVKDIVNAAAAEAAGAPTGSAINIAQAGYTTPFAQPTPEIPEEAKVEPTMEQPAPEVKPTEKPRRSAAKIHEWSDAALETTLLHQLDKPEEARNTALVDSILTEIDTRAKEQGAENVGESIDRTSGVSSELAGQPNQAQPAAGVAEPVSDRVVPTGENVATPVEGEGKQPTALTPTQEQLTAWDELAKAQRATARAQKAFDKVDNTVAADDPAREAALAKLEAAKEREQQALQIAADLAKAVEDLAQSELPPQGEEQPAPYAEATLPVAEEGEPSMPIQDGEQKPVPMSALTTPEALERVKDVLGDSARGPEAQLQLAAQRGGLSTAEAQQILGIPQQPVQQPVQPTEGAQVGTETPQTVQAEAQGQEAPAAAGVTPAEPTVAAPAAGATPKGKKKKRDRTKARTQVELKKAFTKADENYQKSRASTKFKNRGIRQKIVEHMNPQQLMEWAKSFWPLATKAQRELMARLPSIEFLGDWVKDFGMDQISRAADMMTAVLGKQKVMAEETERLIYMLKRAFKADPTLRDKLEYVVYTSTNMEVDPSDPNAKERVPELDSAYEALGEIGKNLYKMVKEHYEKRAAEYLQLLENHINSLPNADEATKKHLMVTLRKHYEASKRVHPYFPLVRDEGEYWLSVGKGDKKEFYIYDSLRARDADRARMMKERGLEADDFASGNSVESLRQDAVETSAFLRAVFDAIEATPAHKSETDESAAKYKESLKDAIYQTYLNVMPERSFRGMFRHRKGRAGYRTDLIQNIASVDGKINSQLARMEYGQQLRNLVDSAQTAIEGREDLQPFVNELGKRVDSFLAPAPHNMMDAVAGLAGRVGFTYLLGGLSLPLLQPMALATSGLGILWGNYKSSAARVGAELTRALLDIPSYGITTPMPDGSVRYHWPSLVNSKKLTDDELRAVRELGASGVHESTLARSVWEHAKNPTSSYVMEPGKELEYVAARTMKGIDTLVGSPFHIAERWTREALFLAAYRLGIEDGLVHDAAVKKAFDNIKEALGDYDSHAKPRWMQRGLGKMAFALKTFAVLITQQTVGNLFKAIPLLNKEGKIEAIKKFSGIMLTTSILAGASGAPLASVFYSFVAGMLIAMEGDDDDDTDEEKDLKSMDPGLWFRSVWLPRHIPNVEIGGVELYDWIDRGVVNALTGLDVASRLQLSSVWGSEVPKAAKTTKEAALNVAADYFGGAYFSMLTQWMNARDAYAAGDTQRAKELASPKFVRDWMRADRYEAEGVKSAGKEVLPAGALKDLELWGQRIGFSPDIIGVTQKEGMKASAGLQKAAIERAAILNKLDIATQKNTAEGDADYDRIMEKDVEEYNRKYPNQEMKDRDIQEALKSREKERDNAIAGITVTKKQADALGPLLERMDRRLEKRAEERKAQIKEAERRK